MTTTVYIDGVKYNQTKEVDDEGNEIIHMTKVSEDEYKYLKDYVTDQRVVDWGCSPIELAIVNDGVDAVKVMLDRGYVTNINEVNFNGWTGLMIAVVEGDEECVEFLLSRGADPTHRSHRPTRLGEYMQVYYKGTTASLLAELNGLTYIGL
jgi:hypothetical protein